jgi:opacity protein-like surface antigen
MKRNNLILLLAALLAIPLWVSAAAAQSLPTASRPLELSAFGGVSADYTGFNGGKNGSLSAGIDLALPPYRGLRPTLEVRGLYPEDKGNVVSQKAGFGGLRVDFLLGHRVHPYGDFLFGRGEMDYPGAGYDYPLDPPPGVLSWNYQISIANILSPGAGVDYDLSRRLAIKIDGQYQIWSGDQRPIPTASTKVHPTIATIGVVYRFGQRGVF